MEKAKFTVYGEPKGKGRPRFNTNTGHAITPKDTVSYENLVKLEWQTAYGTERFPKEAMLDMRIMPGNILGQICPQFTALWFFLSALGIILDDYIRWVFFGEEKPHYHLFRKKEERRERE